GAGQCARTVDRDVRGEIRRTGLAAVAVIGGALFQVCGGGPVVGLQRGDIAGVALAGLGAVVGPVIGRAHVGDDLRGPLRRGVAVHRDRLDARDQGVQVRRRVVRVRRAGAPVVRGDTGLAQVVDLGGASGRVVEGGVAGGLAPLVPGSAVE